ncbi:MAG: hypothetical protein NVS3B20_04960 [Polyangiales bacterium]
MTAPDLRVPFHLRESESLHVAWVGAHATSVGVIVTVSAHDGPFGYVRCRGADDGALVVPRTLLAALPKPPRDVHLEIDRSESLVLPTAQPNEGVFVNAVQSVFASGTDL